LSRVPSISNAISLYISHYLSLGGPPGGAKEVASVAKIGGGITAGSAIDPCRLTYLCPS
jgi:hypothetical protein